MNDTPDHGRCQEELAFFGRVAAGVSHEIRNVLATVGEYAGLLADLLVLAERGTPLDPARLKELSANIARQVSKGTEAMERFSRFAHATDEPTATFDLKVLAGDVAALAQRRLAMAGCRLEAQLPEATMLIRGNPFSLQRAVFSAIELVLAFLEKGELATLKLAAEGPLAVISISGRATCTGEPPAGVSELSAMMKELKGKASFSCAEGRLSLALTMPMQ
jgi:C4-dicarboxylate-specific signal transduction histidine kinase